VSRRLDIPAWRRRDIVRGYQAGLSIRDLAHLHKMSYGTVRNVLVAARTAMRKPGGQVRR
jgi:DNA-directed RNA polymerase specialized sigma24 family protein